MSSLTIILIIVAVLALIIAPILMLKDKTRGNLLGKEDEFLNGTLHDLEMKYVELSKQESA